MATETDDMDAYGSKPQRCWAISWGSDYREADGPMYSGYEFPFGCDIVVEEQSDLSIELDKGEEATIITVLRKDGDRPMVRRVVNNHAIMREPSLLWR